VGNPQLETWARVMVDYSTGVQAGETVAITGGIAAECLLRAIYREVVKRGAFPVLVPSFSGLAVDLLTLGNDDQLQYVSPVELFARATADVIIAVNAETNTKCNSGVDPSRQQVFQKARTGMRQVSMDRAATGELRWSSTLYPTDAYAQDAEMSTADFADFMFSACKLHAPDPASAWRELAADQQRLIDWLKGKSEIHLIGPETDLRLSVKGRTWINSDGHRNFPSGEIFTGPIEDSATGHVCFSYPVVTGGREVEGIRLRFDRGKVVDASAAKNEAYLHSSLDADGGARYLGEFAFGTNFDITKFTKNILLDEKIGGTVHMALGAGYPDSGSQNRSAIHWDMICDLRKGGRVEVDGAPFLVDEKFVV
jgi:aminopeptidase